MKNIFFADPIYRDLQSNIVKKLFNIRVMYGVIRITCVDTGNNDC